LIVAVFANGVFSSAGITGFEIATSSFGKETSFVSLAIEFCVFELSTME
jgi:hypothetical protein